MSEYQLSLFEVVPSAEVLQSKFLKNDDARDRLLVRALRETGFFAYFRKDPPEQSGAYFITSDCQTFEKRFQDALNVYFEICKYSGIQAETEHRSVLTPINVEVSSRSSVVARFLEDKLYILSNEMGFSNPRRNWRGLVIDSPNLPQQFSHPCAKFFEMRLSYSFRAKSFYEKKTEGRKMFLQIDRYFTMKSKLSLSAICEFLRTQSKGIELLNGSFVNINKERTGTGIVKMAREDISRGPILTVMIPSNQSTIDITPDMGSLNPTYYNSRKFIVDHLCPDFEKFKRTQDARNKQWPKDKMSQIVESIHTDLAPLFDKLELNEVKFSVTDKPYVIEEQ
jgi:hypothetical protein